MAENCLMWTVAAGKVLVKCSYIYELEAKNKRLKEKIRIVCVGIDPPDFEETRKSMEGGIMAVNISSAELAFYAGWEMGMIECGEVLSKP